MRFALVAIAMTMAAPAVAQNQDLGEALPEGQEVETVEEDGGLEVSVSYEGRLDDLGIAIPSFATDRNAPTPANANGTEALGLELARVITSDLRNNGLFKPTGPDSLPRPSFANITAPVYSTWNARGADMLVQGYVRARSDDRLTVGCYLYDMALEQRLVAEGWVVSPADWRRAAHKCADLIYSRLTGESPFFDSRIAYIAESGPKGNRTKRLAIMDSDGANHRFITNGQTTALSPRYSPDYSRIAYLSYLDGNPRIYIYDIASGQQTLVTQSSNPTFAPRWSPDGRWILYSMAIGGNTDIYRVSAEGGGTPLRLTDSPSIEVGGSYSPDGSRIVFESDQSGAQQCYVMNADGTGQRRI
ncbi:MAG: Tol-Pal system protein TolB, partial [Qipengyuania vulgaris]